MRARVLIAACLVAAASLPALAQVDASLEATTWRVAEIDGAPAQYAETLQISDHRVAGKGACNRFSAGVKQTGAVLEIGQPVATRMFCQGRMDEERRYFDALHAVHGFVLSDSGLVLTAADGHTLLKLTK